MERDYSDIAAANKFRQAMLDWQSGGVPLWYGWVIVEAYLAGLDAGREEAKRKQDATAAR